MTREELISRIEAGETGQKIDAEIVCLTLAPEGSFVEQSKLNGRWCIYRGYSARDPKKPALWEDVRTRLSPTTSIDAAVALVSGFGWSLQFRGEAFVWGGRYPERTFTSRILDNPAAALVAAWLKATA